MKKIILKNLPKKNYTNIYKKEKHLKMGKLFLKLKNYKNKNLEIY